MARRQWVWIESSLPVLGMVSAVVALAVNMIISKMAMSKGVSYYTLCVYSNGIATLILFPTAFIFHRSKRPKLSFRVLWRIFLLASFGTFADMGSNAGLKYSSPTLGTAMLNLVPAFTYILAVIFRMEKLTFQELSTILKTLGTVVSILGAFIVTFYEGPAILNAPLTSGSFMGSFLDATQNWILGGFLLACASFATASSCVLQASILKLYPAEMIMVAIYCFCVTVQSSIVTLIVGSDSTAWRIDSKIGLIAVLYSAIINIAYRLYVTAWCIGKAGPLFVSLFKPLTIVVAIVISVIFMNDALYLGSLLGSLVLVVGFYSVMWGKAKEENRNPRTDSLDHQAQALLLQDDTDTPAV